MSLGVDWSTSKFIPAGTKTRSPSIGGISVPQVRMSLHLITYLKPCLIMAIELPTFTTNELEAGRVSLAPTVQVMEVAVDTVTTHGMPSITTEGVSKLRFVPVRIIS